MQREPEQKQISLISNLSGSIMPEVWAGVESWSCSVDYIYSYPKTKRGGSVSD